MRRQRVLSPTEAEFIARVQSRFQAHNHGSRRAFGKKVGLSSSSMTAMLDGEQVPHIEKWLPIAEELGFRIDDLFVPVHQKSGLTLPVSPTGLYSPSKPQQGELIDEPGTSSRLQQRITALESDNAKLRATIADIIDLATAARKTQSIATRRRRRH